MTRRVIVIAALLLTLVLVVGFAVKAVSDRLNNAKLEAVLKQEADKREVLEKEKAKLESEIDDLKKSIASQVSEVQEGETVLHTARAATKARTTGERAKEQARYEAELQATALDTRDFCQRWLDECERAKRLGTKPADEPCRCTK